MWGRRIVYLMTLTGCLVFYGFYKEWFSWLLLLTVVLLPWFSLAVSLPAMLTAQAHLRCPDRIRMDVPLRTALELQGKWIAPPVSCRIKLHNSLTDARYVGAPGERVPTEHCGLMTISYDRLFVYDYLGLFCRRLRKGDSCTVYITPKPVPCGNVPDYAGKAVSGWRPKPGGGFSEHHELRLYRPGDDLRNIHWKLAAKTGKLVYREAMEPLRKGRLLTLTLSGSPKQLDRKLGQLLYLSQELLSRQMDHEILCHTGDGPVRFTVTDAASWEQGLLAILRSVPAKTEMAAEQESVLWQHHIGGDGNEG